MNAIPPSLRSAGRIFRRSFSLVALLTLAVGIGANAAIFSLVNTVLLRPLPFAEPERLVGVWSTAPGLKMSQLEQSIGTYLLYRKHSHTLENLGIYAGRAFTLTGVDAPERLRGALATASLFEVLRVPPARGRAFTEADERPGAEPVALLSHALWSRRFGGDPRVVGTTVQLDGIARRIVGVMPESFVFPTATEELWVPLAIDPADIDVGSFNYVGVGRLRPGTTPQEAARDLTALVPRIPEEYPGEEINAGMIEQAQFGALVHPLRDDVVGEVEGLLWILLGAVGVVLVIACANVANLFLVHAEGQQREVAVRTALGASRGDVARVFLSESLLLAVAGGALGLPLAAGGLKLLLQLAPEGSLPRAHQIGLDGAVVAFTLGVSLCSGLLFGLVALLRYGAPQLGVALKEGSRGGTASRARHLGRNLLVGAQVALALVVLISSGLMVRSFQRLGNVNPGIAPHGVLTARVALPEREYATDEAVGRFVQQLLDRVAALPGVAAASAIDILPLSGGGNTNGYSIEDFPRGQDDLPPILSTRSVAPAYFETMRITLVAGRTFDRADHERRTGAVVISESVARRFWPGQSPLGRRLAPGIDSGEPAWYTVVGMVASVRDQGLHEEPVEAVYYPMVGLPPHEGQPEITSRSWSLVVRAAEGIEPESLSDALRRTVWSLDPRLPVAGVRTMERVVAESTARTTFTMLLLVIAAAVALLLGTVGLYGAISYVVRERTHEIGVRMALGAARGDVARLVLRQGLVVTLAGVVVGLGAAASITRFLRALLFEVSPTDPVTFVAVPAILVAVAALASWAPARRAASVDPLATLKEE